MSDRAIHAPEYQTGMHQPAARPACWTDWTPTERGQVVEGWASGVKPGRRNPFWDRGRACGCAATPDLWRDTLRHTPGCVGCSRAIRGLQVASGVAR